MDGSEHVRFCGQCERNVYNLSSLTSDEALDLVQLYDGQMCVRFWQRSDGTMLTRDCPVGLKAFRRRLRRKLAGIMALFAVLVLGGPRGASAQESPTGGSGFRLYPIAGWFQIPLPNAFARRLELLRHPPELDLPLDIRPAVQGFMAPVEFGPDPVLPPAEPVEES